MLDNVVRNTFMQFKTTQLLGIEAKLSGHQKPKKVFFFSFIGNCRLLQHFSKKGYMDKNSLVTDGLVNGPFSNIQTS